jgi:hypothetical protein
MMASANIALDDRAYHPDDELFCALVEIAAQRGLGEPVECANYIRRNILRAIQRTKTEKLNAWSYQRFKKKSWNRVPLRPTVEWATILVRCAAAEHRSLGLSIQPRLSREETIKNATSITFVELRPYERRAVEILRGSKPKSKKNVVEVRAVALATAVNRDWFSANRDAGRPRGIKSSNGIKIKGHSYQVPLSVTEVIATVRPLIDDFAGASHNNGCISVLGALAAAVKFVLPGASRDSIARIATRVKAGGRKLEKPLAV